jgi:hypothetical protein
MPAPPARPLCLAAGQSEAASGQAGAFGADVDPVGMM